MKEGDGGRQWNVPDWRDESGYPQPDDLPHGLWRWEFIRRMPDYRAAWDKAAPIEYKTKCRQAKENGRSQLIIRKPTDVYFTIGVTAYSSPTEFHDLLKYNVRPIHNPRLKVPAFFDGGPSILRYADEDGGYRALAPKPTTRQERVIVSSDSTMIEFDLTELMRPQIVRARKRLDQLQTDYAADRGFVDRLKAKQSARQQKRLWPRYLRVLDARDEGVPYQEIGIKLQGLEELGEHLNDKEVDRILNRREQAKSDAREWHKAALQVAIRTTWQGRK